MLLGTALGLAITASLAAETPPAMSILPPDPASAARRLAIRGSRA